MPSVCIKYTITYVLVFLQDPDRHNSGDSGIGSLGKNVETTTNVINFNINGPVGTCKFVSMIHVQPSLTVCIHNEYWHAVFFCSFWFAKSFSYTQYLCTNVYLVKSWLHVHVMIYQFING